MALSGHHLLVPLNLSIVEDLEYSLKKTNYILAIARIDTSTGELDPTFSQRSPTDLFTTSTTYAETQKAFNKSKTGILTFDALKQLGVSHISGVQYIGSITSSLIDPSNIYVAGHVEPYVCKIQYFAVNATDGSIRTNKQLSPYDANEFNYKVDITDVSYNDTPFNPTRTEDYAEFLSKGPITNKIYVCGETTQLASDLIQSTRKTCWITRMEDAISGTIDTAFGENGSMTNTNHFRENIVGITSMHGFIHINIYNMENQSIFAVREIDTSNVYIAGFVGNNTETDQNTTLYVAKLNHHTCSLDTTFGEMGKGITFTSIGNATSDYVWNMKIDNNGRILMCGYTTLHSNATEDSDGPYSKMYLLRYTSSGQLDATFGSNGIWIPHLTISNSYDLDHDEYGYNMLYNSEDDKYILTGDTYIATDPDNDTDVCYNFISKMYVIDNSYNRLTDVSFEVYGLSDQTYDLSYTATTYYNEYTFDISCSDCSNNSTCSLDIRNEGNQFTLSYTTCEGYKGGPSTINLHITANDVSYTEISFNHGYTAPENIDEGYDSLYSAIIDAQGCPIVAGQVGFVPTFVRYDPNYQTPRELKLDRDTDISNLIIFALTQTDNGRIIFGGYTPSKLSFNGENQNLQNSIVYGALKISAMDGSLSRDTDFYNGSYYKEISVSNNQSQQIYFAESIGNDVFMVGLDQRLGMRVNFNTVFTPPS